LVLPFPQFIPRCVHNSICRARFPSLTSSARLHIGGVGGGGYNRTRNPWEEGTALAVVDDRGHPDYPGPPEEPGGDFGRQPPQDMVAEQSVLGGMLLSKDAIADVL